MSGDIWGVIVVREDVDAARCVQKRQRIVKEGGRVVVKYFADKLLFEVMGPAHIDEECVEDFHLAQAVAACSCPRSTPAARSTGSCGRAFSWIMAGRTVSSAQVTGPTTSVSSKSRNHCIMLSPGCILRTIRAKCLRNLIDLLDAENAGIVGEGQWPSPPRTLNKTNRAARRSASRRA